MNAQASITFQVTALRHAVEQLAHNLGVAPGYCPPNREWLEQRSNLPYAEWDVQSHGDERLLAVRAAIDDGIPGVFLVDRRGDMHALEISHTHRLIEALAASLTYLTRQEQTRSGNRM
jgi:hypothetical protein